MKTRKAILSLVALSLMFCSSMLAQQAPDNVAGNWTIYSTNIENGETVVKHVQITQSGNQLSGFFEGPVQSGPIQGEIHGNYIRFSTVTKNVLNFGGHVYGDRMSGSYGLHGKHAAWQAERQTPVAETATPVTGTVFAYQPVLAAPAPPPAPAPPAPSPQTTVPETQGNSAPTPSPQSADQLDALVAPIALYPDALVAQVLAASENPDQVAYADDWLAQNKSLTGTALAQAVDQQSWDPSVKALTQFPSVLDNLAHNLSWASSLGQAFANQQADVMAAVQTMRVKAQAAGTLQSTSQITVTQPSPNTIVIQPANPQVVYVPQYNPAVVYGAPVVVPLYVPPPVPVASVGLYFGNGVAVGAVVAAGGWGGGGWGWHAWNVNWGGGAAVPPSSTTTTPISTTGLGTTRATTAIVPALTPTTVLTAPITRTDITARTAAGTRTLPPTMLGVRQDRKTMRPTLQTVAITPTLTTIPAPTLTMAPTAHITQTVTTVPMGGGTTTSPARIRLISPMAETTEIMGLLAAVAVRKIRQAQPPVRTGLAVARQRAPTPQEASDIARP